MSVTLRPALAKLPAYVPGRAVPGAIKLASNETPYPPLPSVLSAIAEAAGSVNRYPDNGAAALTDALAAKYGVDRAQVAVGCGSVSLCTQLVQAVADAGEEVIFGWRSFEAYPIIVAVSGASSVPVPLRNYVHDLDAMSAAITDKTRLIFVCNPNNPTSTTVTRDALIAFMRRVPAHIVVALDEAYREFVTDEDVPDGPSLLAQFDNLVVLRTFSKAYGLAGLRVGYAVAANREVAAALGQTRVPFAVTAVAQQAALASLRPQAEAELQARVAQIIAERDRVVTALRELNYQVPPAQGNFVWLPLAEATTEWAAGCEARRIIVRPFAGHGVRVTVGTAEENDLFLAAAAQLSAAAAR